MPEPTVPEVPDRPSSPFTDQTELMKFLREQAEANRLALSGEAAANRKAKLEESEAIRKLFVLTSKVVALPLAVALALAGIFWFRDMNTMKESMKREGETAAQLEIQKMDSHIDETLQAQFNTKSMQDRIDKAAEIATGGKAKALIEDRVRGMIDPIQKQAQASLVTLHLQELVARVNADDAQAFDELISVKQNEALSQQALVEAVIADRRRYAEEQLIMPEDYGPCQEPEAPEFRARLNSRDRLVRRRTIASCNLNVAQDFGRPSAPTPRLVELRFVEPAEAGMTKIAPEIVSIALHDSSLLVRAQAVYLLNLLFRNTPGFPTDGTDLLEVGRLRAWWEKNEANYTILVLISRAAFFESQAWDSVDLFDELQRVSPEAPGYLREIIRQDLTRMRASAEKRNQDSRGALANSPDEKSCSKAGQDFKEYVGSLDLNSEESRAGDIVNKSALPLIVIIKSCSVDAKFLPALATYAGNSRSLSQRFGAVTVLNNWVGARLDPFNSRSIKDWCLKYEADPAK